MIKSAILWCAMLSAISFCAGYWFAECKVPSSLVYELRRPVRLQVTPDDKGSLPKGTQLYFYRELPEITTYYVYVNLKERDLVVRNDGGDRVIDPIAAYPVN